MTDIKGEEKVIPVTGLLCCYWVHKLKPIFFKRLVFRIMDNVGYQSKHQGTCQKQLLEGVFASGRMLHDKILTDKQVTAAGTGCIAKH